MEESGLLQSKISRRYPAVPPYASTGGGGGWRSTLLTLDVGLEFRRRSFTLSGKSSVLCPTDDQLCGSASDVSCVIFHWYVFWPLPSVVKLWNANVFHPLGDCPQLQISCTRHAKNKHLLLAAAIISDDPLPSVQVRLGRLLFRKCVICPPPIFPRRRRAKL